MVSVSKKYWDSYNIKKTTDLNTLYKKIEQYFEENRLIKMEGIKKYLIICS